MAGDPPDKPQADWLPPEPPGPPPPEPPTPPPPFQPPPPTPGMHPPAPPSGFPPPAFPPPPPPGYPPQWQPLPPQPPNGDAVAGFTCSVIGLALLFFTAGLSTIVSLILGIVAVPYSRKGKRNVEEGRTTKHRDLAKAGYVIGIVTIVLSLLATAAWALIFALVDWDEIDESDGGPSGGDSVRAALRLAAGLARLLG
jgi:hypothetical protein